MSDCVHQACNRSCIWVIKIASDDVVAMIHSFVLFFPLFFTGGILFLSLLSSPSFGNLIRNNCSTYFEKGIMWSVLKIPWSSSGSQETIADFKVSLSWRRILWYNGQVARKCCSSSIIASKKGNWASASASESQQVLQHLFHKMLGFGLFLEVYLPVSQFRRWLLDADVLYGWPLRCNDKVA